MGSIQFFIRLTRVQIWARLASCFFPTSAHKCQDIASYYYKNALFRKHSNSLFTNHTGMRWNIAWDTVGVIKCTINSQINIALRGHTLTAVIKSMLSTENKNVLIKYRYTFASNMQGCVISNLTFRGGSQSATSRQCPQLYDISSTRTQCGSRETTMTTLEFGLNFVSSMSAAMPV
jgi:hypothetical protein